MKKILLILIILISRNSFAQDLIVTNNNDSINCLILEKKGSFLIYKKKIGNTYQFGSIKQEFVSKTELQFYNVNPALIKQSIDPNTQIFKPEFFLTFEVNKSTLINYVVKSSNKTSDSINAVLAKSVSFSPAFEYWLSKKVGIGVKYEFYNSKASEDRYPVYLNSSSFPPTYFELEEEIFIHTISPKLIFRTPVFNEKNYIFFHVMYNYNFYKDLILYTEKISKQDYSTETRSKKSGFGFSAGYEYHATKNLKFGFISSYQFCEIDNIFVNGKEIELTAANKLNLNRFNLGLIVGFH